MSKERCGACHFYRRIEASEVEGKTPMGVCRRYPPQRAVDPPEPIDPEDPIQLSPVDEEYISWRPPLVAAEDWCGEFKAREEDARKLGWTIKVRSDSAVTLSHVNTATGEVHITASTADAAANAVAMTLREIEAIILDKAGPVWSSMRNGAK